jgi:hypothetical protein
VYHQKKKMVSGLLRNKQTTKFEVFIVVKVHVEVFWIFIRSFETLV